MPLYGGIDLHANNSVIVLLNEQDEVIYRKRLPNELPTILGQLAPYNTEMQGLVVESTYNWYWLVDGLMEADYRVHLANPAAMQQYSGLKYTDDHSDARWLAHLLRLGVLPEGYIYPKAARAVRDLLRKRAHLVRQHTANVLSVQNIMARNTGARFSVKRIQELTKQELTILLAEETQVLAVTRSLVVLDLISDACSGIAVRLPRASGAVRVRTNCSGSASRPTTGGSCYRWNQKNYAKNCQLRNLQRETIPCSRCRSSPYAGFPHHAMVESDVDP